jgi:TonB family protein
MRGLRFGGDMGKIFTGKTPVRRARILQAAVLVMTLAIASQCLAADRAIKSRVAPVYPELAKRMKITGVVKVEATVDADGKVLDVKPLAGNHMLSLAAEDGVRKWKFAPGEGTAAVPLDINFELGQ